jgi:formylglycine-generating enzyme required for sulfatase activity
LPIGYEYRLPMDAEYDVYVDDATLADSVIGMPKGDTIDWSKVSQSTAVVGSKAPNKFGLYDTRGNVEQWMQDWYTEAIEAKDDLRQPRMLGTAITTKRSHRGRPQGLDCRFIT